MDHLKQSEGEDKNSLREVLASRQIELDRTLVEINEEVEFWNLRLEDLAKSDDPEAQALIGRLAQEAVNVMDEKWPYFYDYLHVSGTWYAPDLSISQTQLEYPMRKLEAFNTVQSNGFNVFATEDGSPRIGLSFVASVLPIYSAAIQGDLKLLTFADLKDINLLYIRPGDVDSLKSDMTDVASEIVYYDQLLHLHYHNQNSEFYRKTAKQQQRFLASLTDKINESLPSPQSGFKPICSEIEVPYVYRRVYDNTGSRWQKIKADDSSNIMMAGNIEGVGILESSAPHFDNPIRGADQLVDPDAGICLILEVDQCSIPDIFNNQPVYVPLRLANQVEIETV